MLTILPEGLERPLVFAPEAAHVADMLGSVLNGWPMRTDVPGMEPLLQVSADGREILLQRPQDGATFREPSAVSAVCSLVVETVDALAAASPDLVCLHAAAAELGGRLVLFPAAHRAGKSTLVARLAAGGRRVFADDILPFDLHREDAVARLPAETQAAAAAGIESGLAQACEGEDRGERRLLCLRRFAGPRDGPLRGTAADRSGGASGTQRNAGAGEAGGRAAR